MLPVDVEIRHPRKDEAEALIAYLKAILAETDLLALEPGELRLTREMEESFIESMNGSENSLFLVALLGGRIVGVATVEGRKAARFRHAGSCGLSVSKAHWRRGIGGALMEAVLDWAAGNPAVSRLEARIHERNDRSIRLFERFGFLVEGRLLKDMRVGDAFFDTVILGREV